MSFTSIMKHPSAFLPVGMSLAALALVLGHLAIFGIVRGGDEGASAHLYQLLMISQVPIMAFFAFNWLRQSPLQALKVLALQVAAACAAFAPIFILDL